MADSTYDGIILGTGHNSLILQAYLCRAGLHVVSLERNTVPGGGLCTEEWPVGSSFLHNTHSFYHRGVTRMPWYAELELERHGAHYLEPDLNVAMLLPDGRSLTWWTDFERTADSFAQFSRRDAASLRRWREAFLPIVTQILEPEAQSPPLSPPERRRRLEATAEGRLLLKTSACSPREFVLREFENPAVQAGLLFFNGLREVDPPRSRFATTSRRCWPPRQGAKCVGGSPGSRSPRPAITEAGGEVRTRRANANRGAIRRRRAGASRRSRHIRGRADRRPPFHRLGLNPQQTFLDLIDPAHLPASWRDQATAFRYNLLAPLFGLYLNLDEAPLYSAAEANPELDDAFMVLLGLQSVTDFDDIVRAHERGQLPPTVMWGSCPSRFDATQAPGNAHTAFMWEKVPFRLRGHADNWDAEATAHGRRMFDAWADYAPNLRDVVRQYLIRPVHHIPKRLPNMRDGDLLVGSLGHGQVGYNRPFPGAGHYRGYLAGLYLCGSCCHPSGNITGLPGYNAWQVIAADLGLD